MKIIKETPVKQPPYKRVGKVAWDMLKLQGSVIIGATGIIFVLNLIFYYARGNFSDGGSNFMILLQERAYIFFLIVGFMILGKMGAVYMKVGVTRREFYYGNLLASIPVVLSLFVVGVFLHGILSLVLTGYAFGEGLAIGNLVKSFLKILQYYYMGWFISLVYKRFSVAKGMVIFFGVAIPAFIFSMLPAMMIESDGAPELMGLASPIQGIIFTGILIWVIYLMNRRFPYGIE